MERFPTLKTGAAAQYPALRRLRYATEARRFLDTSEQRYLDIASPKRTWRLDLRLLTPTELAAIREFFVLMRGAQTTFEFDDPFSGTVVSPCRFGQDSLTERLSDESAEAVAVTIEEV